MSKPLKIILAGGGSGGPTTPLLAVAEQIKKLAPDTEFLFIGTEMGPERQMVMESGIRFEAIPAGKLRRYFALANISDFFRTYQGYRTSKNLLHEFKANLVVSVGSFVGVPVAFAAKKMGIPVFIHQQDARIGLANKIVAPFADCITTAFEPTAKEFGPDRAEAVGNPVREEFLNPDANINKEFFHLTSDLPVLLIFGGATGAEQLNTVVADALPELLKAHQIIHVSGTGKAISFTHPDYHPYEFLGKEMAAAIRLADIVVGRAGLSTISELSALGKVSIIVPMPDSHQEDNAKILKDANAAVVLSKEEFNSETLARVLVSLKFNQKRRELLSENIRKIMPHDSAERIAKIILERYGK